MWGRKGWMEQSGVEEMGLTVQQERDKARESRRWNGRRRIKSFQHPGILTTYLLSPHHLKLNYSFSIMVQRTYDKVGR